MNNAFELTGINYLEGLCEPGELYKLRRSKFFGIYGTPNTESLKKDSIVMFLGCNKTHEESLRAYFLHEDKIYHDGFQIGIYGGTSHTLGILRQFFSDIVDKVDTSI